MRPRHETCGSDLTAIHEGVDVTLRHGFLQDVLRGALGNEIILVLERGRSSSENLPHLPRISLIMICLVSADVCLVAAFLFEA